MIKVVDVSRSIIDLSRRKSEEMGLLNNSITSGEGNLAGFVGEYLVADLIGGEVSNTYDYDVVAKNGKTIDIKTKRTNYPPLEHYECSVAAYNTRQDCDYYFFVRVSNDYEKAWLLGYYPKKEYFKDAVFCRKGDIDPNNNFRFKADCYNMKISSLLWR
mgnify:CR=1 FL=1